jgi:hypothetical protein
MFGIGHFTDFHARIRLVRTEVSLILPFSSHKYVGYRLFTFAGMVPCKILPDGTQHYGYPKTAITNDYQGHDGLQGMFGKFSGFIFMQKTAPNQLVFRELFL